MFRVQSLTSEKYNNKKESNLLNNDTLYFITDTKQIYKGEVLYTANDTLEIIIPDNSTEDEDNIDDILQDIQTLVNATIKEIKIKIYGQHQPTSNFTLDANDIDLYIQGFGCTLNISNAFDIKGNNTTYSNIVFDITNQTEGLATISNNTTFLNCVFKLNNSISVTENLSVGNVLKFENCIFENGVESTVIKIENKLTSGYVQVLFNSCIFNNNVIYINSSNVNEYVNVTYARDFELDIAETNKAIVLNPLDAIFNTVTIIGE